jgi:NAD+ kinase
LPNTAQVTFETLEIYKRPLSAVADNVEFENIKQVTVNEDRSKKATLLFDPGHGFEERILNEQFQF